MKEKRDLNIIFMGTPEFAVASLEKLFNEGYNIKAVVTAPDKPAGRGRKLSESAVKTYAVSQNIPVLQPTSLKDEEFISSLKQYNADLFIIVAFRMLPKAVWEIPALGTFNLHGSLLPQYRGAAPLNWAIINGETETGVTTFFIDEKIDTGEILLNKKMAIGENETAGELHDRMMVLGAGTVIETVELIRNKKANPSPQPEGNLKAAPKISKEDCLIDFSKSIKEIHDFIRGMSPYPTAWTILENVKNQQQKTLKVFRSEIIDHTKHEEIALKSENHFLLLETQNGTLSLCEVQLEGKKRLKAKDFILGFDAEEWRILSVK